MRKNYSTYQAIPLSVIIKRDLQKLTMTQKSLAVQLDMSYHHLNHLLNTSCKFSPESEREIERILDYEPSFISNLRDLQARSRQEGEMDRRQLAGKSIPVIRKCVFWDIDPDGLDWIRHRKFIIARVNRYGNAQEKESVASFYNQ